MLRYAQDFLKFALDLRNPNVDGRQIARMLTLADHRSRDEKSVWFSKSTLAISTLPTRRTAGGSVFAARRDAARGGTSPKIAATANAATTSAMTRRIPVRFRAKR